MAINESIKKLILPCAVMRNLVAFPGVPMTVDMEKGPAKRIFETAIKENSPVFIVCQKDPMEEISDVSGVYPVGVTARIKQTIKTQSGVFRVVIEPISRATIIGFTDDKLTAAEVMEKTVIETGEEIRSRALLDEIKAIIHDFAKHVTRR